MIPILEGRIYIHRTVLIIWSEQGIGTSISLDMFPTFNDARIFVDIYFDGFSEDGKHRTLGKWKGGEEQVEGLTRLSKLLGWMREHEKTQQEFADIVGVTVPTANKMLNGRADISLSKCKKICEAWNISMDLFE